jgi:predicted phosphate transport protein (TIGR00153 family)
MFLKRLLPKGKKEQEVIENMRSHIGLLCRACESFKSAIETRDRNLMRTVTDMEREGDSIRREIISNVYEGAFLPYIRPDLCRFVESVDRVFDTLKDTALHYLDMKLPEIVEGECVRVAFLNARICDMLSLTFEAMLKGENLREKTLAIRIYEKKVDDIRLGLIRDFREIPVDSFWEGQLLADFVAGLTSISDNIEDASDYLQIINISMK